MECQKQTIAYESSNAVDTIFAMVWIPENPRGVLQICHGMCEYIERYDHFARYMVTNGFVVCGHDQIGHGRTAGSPERLGYFAQNDGYKFLTEDVHLLRQIVQKEFPTLPYFLFGHSMGSFVTRNYITKYSQGLRGYICCGTSGPKRINGLALKITDLAIKKHGDLHRSALIQALAFKNYNIKYEKGCNQYAWLSTNTEVGDSFEQDQNCNFIFTNSAFKDLFTLLSIVSEDIWSDHINKYLPIFILSGEMDPVGNYGKGVERVYRKLSDKGICDLKFKIYLGARHELINESNNHDVYIDILSWMKRRM